MRRIRYLLPLLVLLLACAKEQPEEERDYYVVMPDSLVPANYGEHNFILLDSSIYYFRIKPYRWKLGCGMMDRRPMALHLRPNDLNEIKKEELLDFFKVIYTHSPRSDTLTPEITSMSSPIDTIRNEGIKIFARFFVGGRGGRYVLRNTTEEELFVVTAKAQNKEYYPDSVKWKVGVDSFYYENLVLDKAYFYEAKSQMKENRRSKIITF